MSLRLRNGTLFGLSLLLGTSSCQMTMSELRALNPSAATLEVHCHPSQIPDYVKRFAVQRGNGHIVTDEHQDELRNVAPLASVFIEVNTEAPIENARIMASQYGLSCPNMGNDDERSSESLYEQVLHVAQPAQPAQTPTGSGATSLPRIGVCARPNGITVDEWHGGPGIPGTSTTTNAAKYAKQTAKATVIFYLDANAPPESVWNFGRDTKIRCPGKAPIPYDQWVAQNTSTGSQASGSTNAATSASSSSSKPDGKGPPLDPFEKLAQELMFAGKLATTDTSAPATTADGSRHGMPGGKNVGGFSFPALQAGVGLVSIVIGVGMKPQEFIKKVIEKTGLGKPVIVKELNADALKLADDFIKDYGQYVMAESLRKQQVIMPFKMAQKFTEKLESKFQAHKIFERRAIKEFMRRQNPALSEAALDKAVNEVAKTYPSIILSDAEHTEISKALAAAWDKVGKNNMTKEKLREIYKDVYKKEPHWLEAIESYLR
jgi:hypothetical protein